MKPSQHGDPVSELYAIIEHGAIPGELPPYICGDRRSISFTETPLIQSARLLINASNAGLNFIPYGFQFDRDGLYEKGARQTIHQPPQEVELLPLSERYRHVDLIPNQGVDFTWKREWRLAEDKLQVDPGSCNLILPDQEAYDQLVKKATSPLSFHVLLLEDLS
ncbi:hypothetical protein BTA51_26065 [Hahella sp. CCB-MM4]|nr:hypothetical protein BTA51_26065 [Hahella sp. CCB-MM4]